MSSKDQHSPRTKAKKSEEEERQTQERVKKVKNAIRNKNKKSDSNLGYSLVIGGFVVVCVAALASILLSSNKKLSATPVIDHDEMKTHNEQGYSFNLSSNTMFDGWMLSQAKSVLNTQLSTKPSLPRCMSTEDTSIIPDQYNFRKDNPLCSHKIVFQGNCSSSYSIAATSAISDRICKQSQGTKVVSLSAQQAISCDSARNYGCKGGAVNTVFDLAKKDGLIEEHNLPYSEDAETVCPEDKDKFPRHFIQDYCVTHSEEGIKKEIYKYGPVVAVVPVYKDFLVYGGGVYQVLEGTSKFQSAQALKIIGWDKDPATGLGYWIAENSWGETWGENGLVRIAVGQKQLYIEDFVLAPHPRSDQAPQDTASTPTADASHGSSASEQAEHQEVNN